MHWTEPTTWKRVKNNAREIARTYRWRRLCVVLGMDGIRVRRWAVKQSESPAEYEDMMI